MGKNGVQVRVSGKGSFDAVKAIFVTPTGFAFCDCLDI